jgi:hypothetical protein
MKRPCFVGAIATSLVACHAPVERVSAAERAVCL